MPDRPSRTPGRRPLRIALLTHSVNPRGGVVHTLELADALHARGHHVTVFAPATPGQRMFRATRCAIELVAVERPAASVVEMVETRRAAYVAHLAKRLRSQRFDVLHAQDAIGANALADLCDAGAVQGFVRTVHHLDHFEDERLMAWQERAFRRASLVLCVSQTWCDHLSAVHGVPSALVHNGVDLQRYSRRRDASDGGVAAHYGLRPGAPLLLAVGGVEERKNTVALLEAFIAFRATAPSAQLVIAGGASVLDHSATARRFEAIRSAADLSDSVVLTGTVADEHMPALFRAADALLMPSLREGFGLVVLEALASGTPAVVSRIAPFTEYLDADEAVDHCCWADPHSAASIAQAIARACAPAHAEALARGVPPVCERFGWAASAERHEILYRAHHALTESPHARHALQHSMA
ncbi:MAG TPA: MSMEG_0565 family glycosyltransferase [Burkholderiaceae bacterium]|jgi:glycosyltransferase-like protein